MGVPKNIIVSNKYTSGNEFVYAKTSSPYQGYYYEFNGKTFAGKEFKANDPEILKITSNKVNKMLNKGISTAIYSLASGITSQMISTPPVASLPSVTDRFSDRSTRFFYKKYNSNIIKETNEDGYKSLQKNPIYQTTFVGTYNETTQTIDQANLQVPGLKAFLGA